MSYCYLASPYTPTAHDLKNVSSDELDDLGYYVREHRYEEVLKSMCQLATHGFKPFSPIVHTHNCVRYTGMQTHGFWMAWDLGILRHASMLIVLTIDGWDRSRGVREEIDYARANGIVINGLAPCTLIEETPVLLSEVTLLGGAA